MRYVAMSVVLCCLIGCNQERVMNEPEVRYEGNARAAQITLERDWTVTTKEVLNEQQDYHRIRLTLNLKEPKTDPRSGLRKDLLQLEVDDSHLFFPDYNSLKEGEVTYFIHMAYLGGSFNNAASYLAPSNSTTRAYFKEHYDGGGY